MRQTLGSGKTWAWVTSALNEHAAEKAIVLAGSLGRVKTSGKLVVITSSQIAEKTRASLYNHFDLVCVLDGLLTTNGSPASEDQAKVFAFSLSLFQGCVYLSPNSLVLKKFDNFVEYFSGDNFFVAFSKDILACESSGNSSMFAFAPSARHFQSLRQILKSKPKNAEENKDIFMECVVEYAEDNNLKLDVLEAEIYHQLTMTSGKFYDGFLTDLAIMNFGCLDPRGAYTQTTSNNMGLIESYAVDLWWNIYYNEVYSKNSTSVEDLEKLSKNDKSDSDPIAIIGISCRLPGANNLDEFWKLLIEGREGIRELPSHRWKKGHTITPANPKCRKTNGGFLDLPVDEFDAKFFNLSPKEAEFLDPQQRLLHEITWEALEDAAIDPLSIQGDHVGVFVGSWIHDYKDMAVKTADRDFFRIYMGNSIAATAARLSFLYGITGPSIATESGCSSAIGAVDMACKSLRSGETNLAFAAGVNLFLHPFEQTTMSFVLAPDGRCKTFDANADGFGRAEAVGCFILKRMSDAIADGDKIWALIRGSAITQEGVSKSLGTPTVHSESLSMELALKDADVHAKDVSFVETHGTGTQVGDPMEVAAITRVYSKDRREPLIIGSVKTNLGHTEAASGITGIIKVILQMQNDMIAPNLNLTKLNPDINLDAIPAKIPLQPMDWKRNPQGKPRIAGVSSFGISGTDGHAIIEEAPDSDDVEATKIDLKLQRPYHIMKISAKSSEALDQLLADYEKMIENLSAEEATENTKLFPDVAYTANVGRATFNHRAVIVAKDCMDATKILKSGSYKRKELQGSMVAKVCFLFTGQGSQYRNMARELYLTSPVFRLAFDKCDNLLETHHSIKIKEVIWDASNGNNNSTNGIGQEGLLLDRTLYSQVAIFIVEYSLLRLWTSYGIQPHYALGHSLGEFTAAVCCNILSLDSALELIIQRSKLIDSLPQGKMLVIKADKNEVDLLLKSFQQSLGVNSVDLDFAAINSPEQTVLAGDTQLVNKFAEYCAGKQVKSVVLAATHAFHSRHMDPILKNYRDIVEKVLKQEHQKKKEDHDESCQFISGMEGKLIADFGEINSDYWVRHTRDKVNFLDASNAAFEKGCKIFLEVGPSPVLSALITRNNETNGSEVTCLPSLRKNQNEWVTILDSLTKLFLSDINLNVDWKGFDQFYRRRKVSLPFYPFQRKKIWVDFRSTPAKIHPFVGQVIPNASKSTIFESELTLKQLSYLNDHAIGNTVICPGAALLEMSVVAAHCAVQGLFEEFGRPRKPITFKGLRIEAPLAIYDGKATRLQTVIDLNESDKDGGDGLGYSVKIYNWFQNNTSDGSEEGTSSMDGQWKKHASGCFLPLAREEDKPDVLQINIEEIQENWEELNASKNLYEKLPEVGLHFGPTFQSLVRGWKRENRDEDEDQEGILFEVKVPIGDPDIYLIHPVILDAMLQASMLWTNKERIHKKLHVPVQIREFTWLSDGEGDSSVRYVYCTTSKVENGAIPRTSTLLLDSSGLVLASMNGIEFIETTVKLVESMIQQQSFAMPQLWEEIWKPKNGPRQARANPNPIQLSDTESASINAEIFHFCSKLNELDENELKAYHHLDNLTVLYFQNALYKLGWEPKLGEKIVLKDFMKEYGIVDVAWNFLRYFFNEMVSDETVKVLINERDRFVFQINKLPLPKDVIQDLCLQTAVEGEASRGDYRIISEMGKGLADFFVGKSSPLNTLFPEDPTKPDMGCFYDEIRPWVSKTGEVLNNSLTSYNHLFYTKDQKDSVTFRVLEVGSGTGSGTKDYLEFFESKEVNFQYFFTDISAAFFINAEVKFEKYRKQMVFKKFNIEEDPLSQGFTPEYFDLIIACEVIHATKDIRQTLKNLRVLLKTNGHIQITETTKPDRRITLLVGMLEGYWRFTDLDLRPCHATLPSKKWIEVLSTTGYEMASTIGCYKDVHSYIYAFASEEYSLETGRKSVLNQIEAGMGSGDEYLAKFNWLIFCDGSEFSREIQRRLKFLNRNVLIIDKDSGSYYNKHCFEPEKGKEKTSQVIRQLEGDNFEGILYLWSLSPNNEDEQEQLSLPFLHLCQSILELHKATTRIYLMTRGAFLGGEDSGCPNPGSATTWGIAKTLRNEHPEISMHCVDLSPEMSTDVQINDAFSELFWSCDSEELIALRDGKRFVPRLASMKITDSSLNIPSFADRFQLIMPPTKSIADLEFGFLNNYVIKDDEIEIQVKAAALNFRDIFAVLKPTSQFDNINSIGSDFAGVVTKVGSAVTKWKVGDPVFGMNTEQQALPSHLKTKENMVIGMPENFTFAEAATIPAVFATALYCLVSVANIKKGDVCLIHTASGGVGLSAIMIAKYFGATIIATAGSRRKRAYLRSLGVQHVFHSRNTDYGDEILQVTEGRGVDIVLNSLTGPGFIEASIKACGKNARFVEMSKLNIWTEEQVHALRKDIQYTVADLSSLEEEEWKKLMEEMKTCIQKDFVKPIPYTRFDALNIRQALGYLQKAKHIGKVVCIMPDEKFSVKGIQQSQSPKTNLFNDRSTYLITGGLGGIGLEVAKFMMSSGAKHLILASRSPPKPEIESSIKLWNEAGNKVEAWQVDVGDFEQVREMLEKLRGTQSGFKWPPLRGIMHAAGVLSDATLRNQSWDKFKIAYNAKVKGTMNLHCLTRDYQLEHFVLFSSVTSLFGSPGQSNHSSANKFEDAFAQYRHSIGLPATTINFANWGEIGVAVDVDLPGIRPIATRQGLRAIEAILKSNLLQTCVMNVDSFGMVVKLFPKVKGYLDDKRLLGDAKSANIIINTDQFWGEVDSSEGRDKKIDVFKRYIKNMLRSTLKMEQDENIDDNAEFQGLGVDSLMLLEMKNYLQNLFGSRLLLTAAHLKDCNTTIILATRLVDMLEKRNKQDTEGECSENIGDEKGESNTSDESNTTVTSVQVPTLEHPTIVG